MLFFPILALAASASAQSLTEVLAANQDVLSSLGSLVGMVDGLAQNLATMTNITILAPSNSAITNFVSANPRIAGDTTAIAQLLTYHVVSGVLPSSSITETPAFASTMLGGAADPAMPQMATAGLRVEFVMANGTAMVRSGFKQSSRVTQADIRFDGGLVHVVDKVLTVPETPSATATNTGLTALAGALTAANLVAAVDSMAQLTVFAPSNAAFRSVGSAVQGASPQDLANVLTYHAVESVHFSSSIAMATMNGQSVQMRSLGGGILTVSMSDGAVFVNSARVIIPDIITTNGVVHVIDNVLNPAMADLQPNPSSPTQSPAFPGATPASSVPFTSGVSPTATLVPVGAEQVLAGASLNMLPVGVMLGSLAIGVLLLA
ncbi:hypothetical protein S40288_05844 [Stachybotrys chartarum IBT 40288]|nr:hypothetical protein S40288_05844 [Stachybotrys chartarum IBT 40288]